MKTVGIVAEYNPLHNGHAYHLEEAKKIAGADAVIVAMSGNYVQRGEPAIINKWKRAESAISCGADLVVEIPALFVLSDAGKFAGAAVEILESLDCEYISFGSETGNLELINTVAERLRKNRQALENRIKELSKEGLSYPAARQKAYCELLSIEKGYSDAELDLLSNSNDILALEYVLASKKIKAIPVKRVCTNHNSPIKSGSYIQSATSIRNLLLNREDIRKFVPESHVDKLYNNIHCVEDYNLLMAYSILSRSVEEIEDCPSGGEGLANRLKAVIIENPGWNDLLSAVKTKKYTYTRLSRLLMQNILNIRNSLYSSIKPSYIRVLAFNDVGRTILKELKNSDSFDKVIITSINKQKSQLDEDGLKLIQLEAFADDIYNLLGGESSEEYSSYRKHAIYIE